MMDRQQLKTRYEEYLKAQEDATNRKRHLEALVAAFMYSHLEHQVGQTVENPSAFKRGTYVISELRPVLNGTGYEVLGDLLTKKGAVNKAHNGRVYLFTHVYK
jgi:hypothetical protein